MPTTAISRCGGGNTGVTVAQAMLALVPDGLWKLNEAAGVVAADSSGNGYTGVLQAGKSAPVWGQTPIVNADTSARMSGGASATGFENTSFPAYTGDFTALAWFERLVTQSNCTLIQQGDHIVSGWELQYDSGGTAPPNRLICISGSGGTQHAIESDSALLNDVPYFFGVVRSSGTLTLYVNAVAQAATMSPPWSGAGQIQFGGIAGDGNQAYTAAYGHALTAGQLALIYAAS